MLDFEAMKAGLFAYWAAAAAVLIWSANITWAEGFFRLGSDDLVVGTNGSPVAPGTASFRVAVSRVQYFEGRAGLTALGPETALTLDGSPVVVHPILVRERRMALRAR